MVDDTKNITGSFELLYFKKKIWLLKEVMATVSKVYVAFIFRKTTVVYDALTSVNKMINTRF